MEFCFVSFLVRKSIECHVLYCGGDSSNDKMSDDIIGNLFLLLIQESDLYIVGLGSVNVICNSVKKYKFFIFPKRFYLYIFRLQKNFLCDLSTFHCSFIKSKLCRNNRLPVSHIFTDKCQIFIRIHIYSCCRRIRRVYSLGVFFCHICKNTIFQENWDGG